MSSESQKEGGTESLVEGLRQVGLNRYEASVYLGLVTDQNAKVTEISKRTGVPQPKVYQALDSLVEKGFCSVGSDSVNRYKPTPPPLAVESFLHELVEKGNAARELTEELSTLLERGEGRDLWAPPIEILKGIRQVSPVLSKIIGEARDEILFLGKAPILPNLEIPRALWDAGERGVRLRLAYEKGYLTPTEGVAREEVDLYADMPGKKRSVTSAPTKLVLIDGRIAFVSIAGTDGATFLILVLRHRGLVAHFAAAFERYWASSSPLGF